jgi:hypothetical protein
VCTEFLVKIITILNLAGLSKKYWLLHSTSITLARDLSIHVLDYPARSKSRSLIENEIKRRLWWYLATTDWYVNSNMDKSEVLIMSQGYWVVCLARRREHTTSILGTFMSTNR